MFFILRLKPLVDADLGIPPVVVFPSFDRLLQQHDQTSREQLTEFVGCTLGILLNLPLTCIEDTVEFATAHPEEFLEAVRTKQLLVAPGGPLGSLSTTPYDVTSAKSDNGALPLTCPV